MGDVKASWAIFSHCIPCFELLSEGVDLGVIPATKRGANAVDLGGGGPFAVCLQSRRSGVKCLWKDGCKVRRSETMCAETIG